MPRAQDKKFGISSFQKFMPIIAKLLKIEGDCRADVDQWSGSLAKEEGLIPKDRVACVFAARQDVLKLQFCRFVRLRFFLSEKRAKPFLHAVLTTSLSLAVGIPFSLLLALRLLPC